MTRGPAIYSDNIIALSGLVPFSCVINSTQEYMGDRGSTEVKVLCYNSEGRWFDPSWCQWNFSLT